MANGKEESLPQRVGQYPARVRGYIKELQDEMKRVSWPNAKQVRSTTFVVILTTFAFGGYFAIIDLLLSRSVGRIFEAFTSQ